MARRRGSCSRGNTTEPAQALLAASACLELLLELRVCVLGNKHTRGCTAIAIIFGVCANSRDIEKGEAREGGSQEKERESLHTERDERESQSRARRAGGHR